MKGEQRAMGVVDRVTLTIQQWQLMPSYLQSGTVSSTSTHTCCNLVVSRCIRSLTSSMCYKVCNSASIVTTHTYPDLELQICSYTHMQTHTHTLVPPQPSVLQLSLNTPCHNLVGEGRDSHQVKQLAWFSMCNHHVYSNLCLPSSLLVQVPSPPW